MSKANDSAESAGDRGNASPPWQRGETTAVTPNSGMTAGDMARAAAAGNDTRSAPSEAATQAVSAQSASASSPGPSGKPSTTPPPAQQAAARQQTPTAPPGPAPQNKTAPQVADQAKTGSPGPDQRGMAQPNPGPSSGAGTVAKNAVPAGPAVPPGAAVPVNPGVSAGAARPQSLSAPSAKEHPDLDAIHKVGSGDGAARASVRRIPAAGTIGTPLRAAVQVRRVDPWSVFKVTGVLAIAGFLIWMIAIAVLYGVLAGMGIWDQVNSSFATIVSADGTGDGGNLITAGQVFGFSALFGVFAAIAVTALGTIMAYIYNVCADAVGGFEVTLADLD